ncbi:MAG: ATP-dependent zinc metalloprotease FtsH [candidate division WOR-3 bacterium]
MEDRENLKNRNVKSFFFFLLIVLTLWVVTYQLFFSKKTREITIPYSRFKYELKNRNLKSVILSEKLIRGEFKQAINIEEDNHRKSYKNFVTILPIEDPNLINEMVDTGVEVKAKTPSIWPNLLLQVLPFLFIIFIFWYLFLRQVQSGQSRAFTFGRSRAKIILEDKPKTTFNDVAGVEEAKEELEEIIEFLKAPLKFQRLGGRIPKGVLLLGPPGTGKTLLAKAIAGEAKVPFLSISGSDFVEMFVGVGASRVRDLFDQAKRNAPCIIFIDEIDAVGRQRGSGLGGGHDEREQTLNQLLVEMDGFETNEGVIIMAATNRPDILDPALLRPGRFDRMIVIDRPDVKGRLGILKVHTRKIPLDSDVDLEILARGTPGFSGADLANMVNEAALLGARRNRSKVAMVDFEDAKDKVLMGVERRSLIISDDEKRLTAYHECGHVLVSKNLPNMDPIHKVTIIPRGMALGVTQALPIDDRRTYSKTYCLNQITFMLGGRVAELLVLKDLSTGSGNDIEKATELARKMVCEWGMSEKLGPLTLGKRDQEIFLGRELGLHRNFSEETARIIDEEIKRIVDEAEARALKIIEENINQLHLLARTLLEKEILSGDEIDQILKKGPDG